MVPKKVAMHSPGNPGKRHYRVGMLVDTWNGSPRHVSVFFCVFFGYVSCCEHRLWWLWCTIGGLGTLRKCYVSSPVAKALLWFWIENHDWHNCFWMSSWGSPLLGPKKLQNQQFYIIDWIRKKLCVDVANLATCCHDDYDALLEVWEPCANAMLVVALVSQPLRQRARERARVSGKRRGQARGLRPQNGEDTTVVPIGIFNPKRKLWQQDY